MAYDSKASYFTKSVNNTDIVCQTCLKEATFIHLKIKDVEPEILNVIYEYSNCDIKNSSIFVDKIDQQMLVITCNFSDKDDLEREINLSKNSLLTIEYQDITYEYKSSVSKITNLQKILKKAINTLSDSRNDIIFGNEHIKRSIKSFKNILINPVFYMRIEDPKGSSRVGKYKKSLYQMQSCSLQRFNDEKVFHKYYE